MDHIGIIGCGRTEHLLMEKSLTAGVIGADKIVVSTSSIPHRYRAADLKKRFGGIEICDGHRHLAEKCRRIFICVEPVQLSRVLTEIVHFIRSDTHLISTAAVVSIRQMQSLFTGKISRICPVVISEQAGGFTLVCHNRRVRNEDARFLNTLLGTVGSVRVIDEPHFDLSENLIQAALHLIPGIFREFVQAGRKFGRLSQEEAEEMVVATFMGTSTLFHERIMKFPDTVSQVATRGGITEVGNALLRRRLPAVFEKLFVGAFERCRRLKSEINRQYTGILPEGDRIKNKPMRRPI